METDDRQMIARVLDGNTKEFGMLLRRHAQMVKRFIGRMVANDEDAEELTQNVFVKAYVSLASYDEGVSKFDTWLQRIAYHEAVDYLRKKAKDKELESWNEEQWTEEDKAEEDEPFDDVRPDRVELLQRAILTLPKDDQQLLHLRYVDGVSLKDIGFIVNRQPDYLATRLQRLRKRLHHLIKQMERHEKD